MAFRVPSYFALRVCLRVEVTEEEARAAIAWAEAIDGWDPEGLNPLWVFPALPLTDSWSTG